MEPPKGLKGEKNALRLGDGCQDKKQEATTNLVSEFAVVLQDVVVLGTRCQSDLLGDWEHIGQIFVRKLVELFGMI